MLSSAEAFERVSMAIHAACGGHALGVAVTGIVLSCVTGLPRVARGEDPPPAVFDLHVDLPYQVNFRDRTLARGSGQYVADWLPESGVESVVFPLFVPRPAKGERRMQQFEDAYQATRGLIERSARYQLSACELRPGQVGVQFSFEGMEPFGNEPEAVRNWTARGVRLFGLVHSQDTSLASSSGTPGPHSYGLSAAGRRVAEQIYAAGGFVDVSHASDEAFADVLALARRVGRPVVASHSNARAIGDHPRNLTDAQLHGIATTGGVVGLNFHSRFLHGKTRPARLEDVVRQARYLIDQVGDDHVAIGSDFEGDIRAPQGLRDVRGFRALATALRRAGLSYSSVRQLFGGNARRLLCTPPPATAPAGVR